MLRIIIIIIIKLMPLIALTVAGMVEAFSAGVQFPLWT
jgi:hypothetical protein